MRTCRFLGFFAAALVCGFVTAAGAGPATMIRLNSVAIDTARVASDGSATGSERILVQYSGPASVQQRTALLASVDRIYAYLPELVESMLQFPIPADETGVWCLSPKGALGTDYPV